MLSYGLIWYGSDHVRRSADADDAVVPFAQHCRRPQQRAVPAAFPRDLGVQGESALAAAHWQPKSMA
jgi:hypothetical protein